MLHIVLTILKIIGIILLVIIGLILVICACILFVPVRYSAKIKYKDEPDVQIRVTYLLHMINATYIIKGKDKNLFIKIFGFRTHFFDKDKREKNDKYDEDTEMFEEMSRRLNADMKEAEDSDVQDIEVVEIENEEEIGQKKRYRKNDRKHIFREDVNKSENDENDEIGYEIEKGLNIGIDKSIAGDKYLSCEKEEYNRKGKTKSIYERVKEKITCFINKIKYRFMNICGTIKNIGKNINEKIEFLKKEETRNALYFVKGEAIKVLRHIRPRKVKGYVTFGFDNPAYTGQTLGIIYMLTKGPKDNLVLKPDFANKIFESDAVIKGRVQAYYLLYIAIRVYKNKNFNSILKKRRKNG